MPAIVMNSTREGKIGSCGGYVEGGRGGGMSRHGLARPVSYPSKPPQWLARRRERKEKARRMCRASFSSPPPFFFFASTSFVTEARPCRTRETGLDEKRDAPLHFLAVYCSDRQPVRVPQWTAAARQKDSAGPRLGNAGSRHELQRAGRSKQS
jgi:hypothetical protein